jgi:hypothetical protein
MRCLDPFLVLPELNPGSPNCCKTDLAGRTWLKSEHLSATCPSQYPIQRAPSGAVPSSERFHKLPARDILKCPTRSARRTSERVIAGAGGSP